MAGQCPRTSELDRASGNPVPQRSSTESLVYAGRKAVARESAFTRYTRHVHGFPTNDHFAGLARCGMGRRRSSRRCSPIGTEADYIAFQNEEARNLPAIDLFPGSGGEPEL